jgi:hypothetical protein
VPSLTGSNEYLLTLAILGAADNVRSGSQTGPVDFIGGNEFGDQDVFDVPERLQPFLDGDEFVGELKLFVPVALIFAEDRATVGVRYGIDN